MSDRCTFVRFDTGQWRCLVCGDPYPPTAASQPPVRDCPGIRFAEQRPRRDRSPAASHEPPVCGRFAPKHTAAPGAFWCGSPAAEFGWCSRHEEIVIRDFQPRLCMSPSSVARRLRSAGIEGEYLGRACSICPDRPLPKTTKPPAGPRFITVAQLALDAMLLARKLMGRPIAGVIGVPRSGMIPASIIATALGSPLYTISKRGILTACGVGRRMRAAQRLNAPGRFVLVDDSVNSGEAMRRAVTKMSKYIAKHRLLRACVYCRPLGRDKVDVVAQMLPLPHYFEWHLFGSPLATRAGFDLDGALIKQGTGCELQYWPCAYPLGAVISGRAERDRDAIKRCLERRRIRTKRLDLFDDAARPRRETEIAAWKGERFGEYDDLRVFIESHDHQAAIIARVSGKPVISIQSQRVFQP